MMEVTKMVEKWQVVIVRQFSTPVYEFDTYEEAKKEFDSHEINKNKLKKYLTKILESVEE